MQSPYGTHCTYSISFTGPAFQCRKIQNVTIDDKEGESNVSLFEYIKIPDGRNSRYCRNRYSYNYVACDNGWKRMGDDWSCAWYIKTIKINLDVHRQIRHKPCNV